MMALVHNSELPSSYLAVHKKYRKSFVDFPIKLNVMVGVINIYCFVYTKDCLWENIL